MVLELYLDLFSQPCRSVYIFAKKNNIPFEHRNVSLMAGEHLGEEFGKINKMRKVPAMRDDDFCLAESIAIMTYMAEKYKTADHWYPADLKQRAKVNEYLSWQHAAMRLDAAKIIWLKIMIPAMGMEVPQIKLDSAIEDLNNTIKVFEDVFLQDKSFIIGEHISLADLVAIVEIMQPVCAGLNVFDGRPKLRAWKDRVRDTIGAELFDEAHQGIMAAQEMAKKVDLSQLEHFKAKITKKFL